MPLQCKKRYSQNLFLILLFLFLHGWTTSLSSIPHLPINKQTILFDGKISQVDDAGQKQGEQNEPNKKILTLFFTYQKNCHRAYYSLCIVLLWPLDIKTKTFPEN